MSTPTAAELASEYIAVRDASIRAWSQFACRLAGLATSVVLLAALWGVLDPQPVPLTEWVTASSAQQVSAATLGIIATVVGAYTLGRWHAQNTLARALDGMAPAWRRIAGAVLLVAGFGILLAPDSMLWACLVGLGAWVPTWFESGPVRPKEGRDDGEGQ